MSSKSNKKMSFDPNHAYIFGLEIAVVIKTFLSKQEKNPDFVDEKKVETTYVLSALKYLQ